ncbi:rod shape-determining protein MreC [Cytophaga aurantiaca]|uniref:rod shape-determining protein MreC n=1 Tax=Cytophaga aurantiaca TaxID=29530 RepID=UPI000476C22C|nr:rod shape-determining protein MreC [Cytophaga aurantiaca]
MYRLFQFIYNLRVFLVFLCLELFCLGCIVSYNPYQGAAYFSTSKNIVGKTLEMDKSITGYFNLTKVNAQLAKDNAELKNQLAKEIQKNSINADTSVSILKVQQFNYSVARVINNSTLYSNNFFTIDKGSRHGLTVGMGIISPNGVAGQIKACSENFATAISVLNTKWSVSARIKNTKADGIIQWDGSNPAIVQFTNVGRHHKIKVGDTIVTSGYKETLFPEGLMIGTIKNVKEEGGAYWNIDVKLATDYTAMDYVFVIKNILKIEKDSLEAPFIKDTKR